MRGVWEEYYKNLYNIDVQQQVTVNLCGFDGVWRVNYFGGVPIRRTEVEVKVGKLESLKMERVRERDYILNFM